MTRFLFLIFTTLFLFNFQEVSALQSASANGGGGKKGGKKGKKAARKAAKRAAKKRAEQKKNKQPEEAPTASAAAAITTTAEETFFRSVDALPAHQKEHVLRMLRELQRAREEEQRRRFQAARDQHTQAAMELYVLHPERGDPITYPQLCKFAKCVKAIFHHCEKNPTDRELLKGLRKAFHKFGSFIFYHFEGEEKKPESEQSEKYKKALKLFNGIQEKAWPWMADAGLDFTDKDQDEECEEGWEVPVHGTPSCIVEKMKEMSLRGVFGTKTSNKQGENKE